MCRSLRSKRAATFIGLHALDLSTGEEKLGGPVVISATAPGTGDGSDANGNINFVPRIANQRSGLTLNNGVVYVPFASHGDNGHTTAGCLAMTPRRCNQ